MAERGATSKKRKKKGGGDARGPIPLPPSLPPAKAAPGAAAATSASEPESAAATLGTYRVKYVNAVVEWFRTQMKSERDEAEATQCTGGVPLEESKRDRVVDSHGFAPLHVAGGGAGKTPSDDAAPPTPHLGPLQGPGHRFLVPHAALDVRCAFCHSAVPYDRCALGYHDPSWPTPWFLCCGRCADRRAQ